MGRNIVGIYDSKEEVVDAVSKMTNEGHDEKDILIYTNGDSTNYLEYMNSVNPRENLHK